MATGNKYAYPHQVPAATTVTASRGPAPRDNFRVTTKEDDERVVGSAAQEDQLGQAGLPAGAVAPGAVRKDGSAAEGPKV